jgi:glyoxylase-like metal-dependent hydrolase (beta-lactamase superfamily II)/rhodanese-related sulfurtransferase
MGLVIRQFRAEQGCNALVLGDPGTRSACVIDPRVDDVDLYEEFLALRGLKAAYVIDTHTHADHYSGSHLVASHLGARVAMSEATRSARAALRLRDGETIELGPSLGLRVLATPGHTPDSVSLVATSGAETLVLTGDTLFIGGSGRTDFPGASPESQYDSIYKRLAALEGSTWVIPGHDYSGLLLSTIAEEKKTNPHWLFKSREEFVRAKNAEALECGAIVQTIVDFNLSATPPSRPRGGAHTACATVAAVGPETARRTAAEVQDAISAAPGGTLVVDVREPDEFASSRLAGSVNIPLSEIFLHQTELRKAKSVVFLCEMGPRSQMAARTMARLGVADVADLQGGIRAWIAAGFPLER